MTEEQAHALLLDMVDKRYIVDGYRVETIGNCSVNTRNDRVTISTDYTAFIRHPLSSLKQEIARRYISTALPAGTLMGDKRKSTKLVQPPVANFKPKPVKQKINVPVQQDNTLEQQPVTNTEKATEQTMPYEYVNLTDNEKQLWMIAYFVLTDMLGAEFMIDEGKQRETIVNFKLVSSDAGQGAVRVDTNIGARTHLLENISKQLKLYRRIQNEPLCVKYRDNLVRQ